MISRWLGRENEKNVARTRNSCGWPSSPRWFMNLGLTQPEQHFDRTEWDNQPILIQKVKYQVIFIKRKKAG